MYRTSFPDLEWLKQRIASGTEWPTCILDVTGVQDYRSDIQGPYSLFTVQSGTQYCKNEHEESILEPGTAFCSNDQERYTLDTQNTHSHVFNIHFGKRLSHEVMAYLHIDEADLLEGKHGLDRKTHLGQFQLTSYMQQLLRKLKSKRQFVVDQSPDHHYLVSHLLFSLMLRQHQKAFEKKMRKTRASTKREIAVRLQRSMEFLCDHITQPPSLEQLAQSAAMSKFHYLRSFSEAFGTTPHRFAEQLRLGHAKKLLQFSNNSIKNIAMDLGYQSSDHFSRSFKGSFQQSPRQFRQVIS